MGLLHAIGKVRVPKEILTKPGRLTPEEMVVIATHPEEGARILLEKHKGMQMATVVAYEHHVCIDGHGYPRFQWSRGCQDRKSTRLNSSHSQQSRMPSSA